MIERLDLIEKRYQEINELLMQSDVISDVKRSRELSIELSSIEETVKKYQEYKKVLSDKEESKEMLHDPEIADYAREELNRLNEEEVRLLDELKVLLLPKDPNDGKNVIMEIRGAAGGDEANIFAGDLFRMYQKYCENNGWKLISDINKSVKLNNLDPYNLYVYGLYANSVAGEIKNLDIKSIKIIFLRIKFIKQNIK